jgi:asparagine synthase (glutamine-hydrolysing)
MCGVLALMAPSIGDRSYDQAFTQMLQPLRESRGPDAYGVKKITVAGNSSQLYFGHARLSIIDLSEAANQPFVDPKTGFMLTYNGEIYNYQDLRRQLSADYDFRTQSDTEVLLAALQIWGLERALDRLRGMFAFVAYDPVQKRLLAARDRAGEKPLCYGQVNGCWIFTSDMRALQHFPGWAPEVDLKQVATFLQQKFIPQPATIYPDFNKLGSGQYLTMSVESPSIPEVKTYWSIWDELQNKDQSSIKPWQVAINDSVKSMLSASDVEVGCFLSGGVDSSLVAALAAKQSDRPLKTYTIQFLEADYDESQRAQMIAKSLGLDSVVVPFGSSEFAQSFFSMQSLLDEPVAVQSLYALGHLSQRAKQDVKLCLGGDGGDELFAGYNRYIYWHRYQQSLVKAPKSLRLSAAKLLGSNLGQHLFAGLIRLKGDKQAEIKLAKVQRSLLTNSVQEYYQSVLFDRDQPIDKKWGVLGLTHWHEAEPGVDPLQWMMAQDFSYYLPGDVLNKVDKATMAYGLEARAPFLDLEVIRSSFTLSTREKIDPSVGGKANLKKWLVELLPNISQHSPKSGFTAPESLWAKDFYSKNFAEKFRRSSLYPYMGPGFSDQVLNKNISAAEVFPLYSLIHWLEEHQLKVRVA